MTRCFFVSDLHGRLARYERLFVAIDQDPPASVFLGGDLLPFPASASGGAVFDDFVADFLAPGFRNLRERLGERYPEVFLILGNDDPGDSLVPLYVCAEGGCNSGPPDQLQGVVSLASRGNSVCAVLGADGKLVCWGERLLPIGTDETAVLPTPACASGNAGDDIGIRQSPEFPAKGIGFGFRHTQVLHGQGIKI